MARNKINLSNRQLGFTLVELLVVIGIMGVLSGIVFQAVRDFQMRSRDAQREADARKLLLALELYFVDNGEMVPCGFVTSTSPAYEFDECLSASLRPYILFLPEDPLNDSQYYYQVCTAGSGCNNAFPDDSPYWVWINREKGLSEYFFVEPED